MAEFLAQQTDNSGLNGAFGGYAGVAMSVLGLFTDFAGQRVSASAARAAGDRARVAAQFEAQQLIQNAGQAVAAGQVAAVEQARQARLLQSKAIAIAAGSGAGVSDETIVTLLARNAGEGAYRAAVALYQGEDKARQMRMQASTRMLEGDLQARSYEDKARGYEIGSWGTMAKGASGLLAKYGKAGGDGPNNAGTTDRYEGTGFVNEG